VQNNGKFRCVPSEDNYQAFRQKVKHIVNNSNYGAVVKALKLSRLVRGWRNYHRYCRIVGARFSLYFIMHRAWKVFARERKLNRYQVNALISKAFPSVPNHEHKHVKVKGDKSPFDGDITYALREKLQILRRSPSSSVEKTATHMWTLRFETNRR